MIERAMLRALEYNHDMPVAASTKHPRIAHLPWSTYADADDIRAAGVGALVGVHVTVLEKRDGENTTLYRGHHHARSIMSGFHPSRTRLAALHGAISHSIPADVRICGENVSAVHTLRYHALRSIFEVFSAWRGSTCMSWDETERLAAGLGLSTVPVIWCGTWDETAVRAIDVSRFGGDPCEGYVVRPTEQFDRDDFGSVVFKHRALPINAGEHWMHKRVEWNCVAGSCKHGVVCAAR